MAAFDRMATVTASTKRASIVGGLETDPVTVIAALACSPLDPVSPDVAQVMRDLGFFKIMETQCASGLDIQVNDVLVVGAVEYTIRAVDNWTQFLRLLVEEG